VWQLAVGALRQIIRTKSVGRRSRPHAVLLRGELLEARTLLSANQIVYDPATMEVAITGTAHDDRVIVSYENGEGDRITVRAESLGEAGEVVEATFER